MSGTAPGHHPRSISPGGFLPHLVSRKTGILKGLHTLFRSPAEPRLHVAISELTDSRRYLDCYGEVSGTGVGLTEERALMSAIGEAVEAYCSYDIQQPLVLASYKEVFQSDPHAVSPQELPLYSVSQYAQPGFRFRPFTEDTVVRWGKGTSAISGAERSLPAALVYISYSPIEHETPICHSIFGGIASGTSYTAALLSGLYEAIERDAMMIWWLGQLPMAKVHISPGSWLDEIFERCFVCRGLTFELWHITMDIPVPVFFGLVTDKANNAIAGGFGTNLSPEVAALKALFECVQNRLGQLPLKWDWGKALYNDRKKKNIFAVDDPESPCQFSRMLDLNNNLQAYLDPEAHHLLDAVRSGTTGTTLAQIPDRSSKHAERDLQTCLGLLRQRGFDAIVTDLTHEDVADLGFVVLRVSIPGLVPNSVTARPYLGNPRLYCVPCQKGFPPKTEADMARIPMPYA